MKRFLDVENGQCVFVSATAGKVLNDYPEFFPKCIYDDNGKVKETFSVGDRNILITDPEALEAIKGMNFIPDEQMFTDATYKDLHEKALYIRANHERLVTIIGQALSNSGISASDALFIVNLTDALGKDMTDALLYESQKPSDCREKNFKRRVRCIEDMYASYDLDISELAYIRKKEEEERKKEEGFVKTFARSVKNFFK